MLTVNPAQDDSQQLHQRVGLGENDFFTMFLHMMISQLSLVYIRYSEIMMTQNQFEEGLISCRQELEGILREGSLGNHCIIFVYHVYFYNLSICVMFYCFQDTFMYAASCIPYKKMGWASTTKPILQIGKLEHRDEVSCSKLYSYSCDNTKIDSSFPDS